MEHAEFSFVPLLIVIGIAFLVPIGVFLVSVAGLESLLQERIRPEPLRILTVFVISIGITLMSVALIAVLMKKMFRPSASGGKKGCRKDGRNT